MLTLYFVAFVKSCYYNKLTHTYCYSSMAPCSLSYGCRTNTRRACPRVTAPSNLRVTVPTGT